MKPNQHKGIRALERTRNITSALYLVTDFIPERDPIRTKIRETALEAVAVMMSDRGIVRADFHLVGHRLNARLVGVLSLLDIARVSGFVSEMNHKLISSEINRLIDFISSDQKPFAVAEVLGASHYGKVDDITRFARNKHEGDTFDVAAMSNGHHIGQSRTSKFSSKGHGIMVSENRSSRKEIIINELKKQESMSVRDLVSVIKGVSEKTIQRDLISMTKDKIVGRTGEKRWSRYSLLGEALKP